MTGPIQLTPLLADAGVPMLFLTLPAMLGLLIPIIVLEGFYARNGSA
jgi:hypothetical protein